MLCSGSGEEHGKAWASGSVKKGPGIRFADGEKREWIFSVFLKLMVIAGKLLPSDLMVS